MKEVDKVLRLATRHRYIPIYRAGVGESSLNTIIHHSYIPYTPSTPHYPTFKFISAPYENLSPFRLLNTSLASYLLFPSPSLSGACLVAAGSAFACTLGFPVPSSPAPLLSPVLVLVLGAVVFALTTLFGLIVGFEAVGGVCSP